MKREGMDGNEEEARGWEKEGEGENIGWLVIPRVEERQGPDEY